MSEITPILLITFNRPKHTQKVLESIKNVKPQQLFVFQDGARLNNNSDIEKCQEVRTIIQNMVDWPCEIHTNYSSCNLGCGPGPASAISWFFEHVEKGIIIEDDAVIAPDFYEFATDLLERYNDDKSVCAIASICILSQKYGDGSYYFSMMNRNLCAWATWRRAWKGFDISLSGITEKKLKKCLCKQGMKLREREYWFEILQMLQKDGMKGSSWDIQFLIKIWLNNQKGICPNYNLSTNIGFDEYATHINNKESILANCPLESIVPIVHPSNHDIIERADRDYHKMFFQPYEYGMKGFFRLPYRINKRLKKFLGHKGSWIKF